MKIVSLLLKYDYGDSERGESLEKSAFFPALESLDNVIHSFWLEDHGFPDNRESLQTNILSFCNEIKPDIIFMVLMNNEITIETLHELSAKYITINWFCDDQWRFNSYSKNICFNFTYSITVDKYSYPKYKSLGYNNVILSQWATNSYRNIIDDNKTNYKYDISFVGSKNLTREWIVSELIKSGYSVDCFGAGWSNGRVSFKEMDEIFYNSKINLNISNSIPIDYRYRIYVRKHLLMKYCIFVNFIKLLNLKFLISQIRLFINPFKGSKKIEQIKARHFEILGNCGFQIAQYALEVEDYYTIGKEIVVFSTIDELTRLIDYYLENNKEREELKNNGYIKTKNYTYKKRMAKMFNSIQKNRKARFIL